MSSSQPVICNSSKEVTLIAKTRRLHNGILPSLASLGCCGFRPSSEKIQQSPLWHKCAYTGWGGVGNEKQFLETQGAYKEPWAGVKKAQCVPGSCCANVFSCVSHESFAVVTTDLNIVGSNV